MDTQTIPVEDTVAKVDGELAVGEDLAFQRRWWVFERWTWRVFALIVVLDLLGAFGRGPLASAEKHTPDGAMRLSYERVERFNTPSILTLHFSPAAVQNNQIRIWVSDSVLKRLGNQRISPEPLQSTTSDDGVIYTFSAGPHPNSVEFALQPADAGPSQLTVSLVSQGTVQQPQDALSASVFVMP